MKASTTVKSSSKAPRARSMQEIATIMEQNAASAAGLKAAAGTEVKRHRRESLEYRTELVQTLKTRIERDKIAVAKSIEQLEKDQARLHAGQTKLVEVEASIAALKSNIPTAKSALNPTTAKRASKELYNALSEIAGKYGIHFEASKAMLSPRGILNMKIRGVKAAEPKQRMAKA